MEMHYFQVADAVAQGIFDITYFPGKENLADYQSKRHAGAHHLAVCPGIYISPRQYAKYFKLVSQALWKDVLELFQTGT